MSYARAEDPFIGCRSKHDQSGLTYIKETTNYVQFYSVIFFTFVNNQQLAEDCLKLRRNTENVQAFFFRVLCSVFGTHILMFILKKFMAHVKKQQYYNLLVLNAVLKYVISCKSLQKQHFKGDTYGMTESEQDTLPYDVTVCSRRQSIN